MVDPVSVAEGALASENVTIVLGVTLADSASASASVTYQFFHGGLISDSAVASDSVSYGARHSVTGLVDSAKATDAWTIQRIAALATNAHVTEAWTVRVLSRITEQVKASDAWSAKAAYHVATTLSAVASEAWTVVNARTVQDTAHAHDSVSISYTGSVQVADSAQASDLYTAKRTVHASINEVVVASDVFTPRAAYQVVVLEPVNVVELYSLGGSNTAWAINTRTQAVTEYRGFVYNSFATMGRKYIAADQNGLYELNGPSDDGVKVYASLTGGFLEPNGGKFAGLKGVYLGLAGQGNMSNPSWLLKIDTGDGRELTYRTTANPNLMTTKFRIGKGLKARFLGWHVETEDGQDFCFDSIEFVPSMSGRRV